MFVLYRMRVDIKKTVATIYCMKHFVTSMYYPNISFIDCVIWTDREVLPLGGQQCR